MKRYQVKLTNRNGYTIMREADSFEKAKQSVSIFPLSVFFGWIYDKANDQMIAQNIYGNTWKRCTNETFVPHY